MRQSEQVKKQQTVVRGDSVAAVGAVKSGSRLRQKPRSKSTGATPRPQACTRCGKSPPHGKPQCPAREAICRACHNKGHYKRCCKTKVSIQQVAQDDRDSCEDDAFLGTIGVNGVASDTSWSVKLKLNDRTQEFKVDTGADITVIPETAYKRERDGDLVPSNLPLSRPTGEMRMMCGKFSGSLRVESTRHLRCPQPSQSTSRQASHRGTEHCSPCGASTGTGYRETISTSVQRVREVERELHHQLERKRHTFCPDYPNESTHTAAT